MNNFTLGECICFLFFEPLPFIEGKIKDLHLFKIVIVRWWNTFSEHHYVKNVCIRSFCGPYFPAFRLNTERYSVSLRIQSECGEIRTRKTPNSDTFHKMRSLSKKMQNFLLRWWHHKISQSSTWNWGTKKIFGKTRKKPYFLKALNIFPNVVNNSQSSISQFLLLHAKKRCKHWSLLV